MKIPLFTRRLWIVIVGLLLLHLLFPPRLYLKDNKPAGRSLLIWPHFHQADRKRWDPSVDGTISRKAFDEFERTEESKTGIISWNPARFDYGTYFSELLALLGVGAVITICRDLWYAKNKTEQVAASDR